MPFVTGLLELPKSLEVAYIKSKDNGSTGEMPAEENIRILSEDLGDAIHAYAATVQVATVDTIEPGQSAVGPAGSGTYNAPGTGAGIGTVRFEDPAINTLKMDIQMALLQVKNDGTAGQPPPMIIKNLSRAMATAIHKFAIAAIVETDVIVAPGVVIVGYMTPAPAPLPATSMPGLGQGTGNLS